MTKEDAVAGIAATTTGQGLKVTAVPGDAAYPGGIKISDQRMKYLEDRILDRQGARGEWNYAILPAPRPAAEPEPEPRPGPGPALLAALAALAGIPGLDALLDAAAVPWQAAREQRLHLDRGHGRRKASGGGPRKLPYEAIVTAAACHLRLRMPFRLLGELLGAHESTIRVPVRRVTPLLAGHGITPAAGGTRISTLTELREHAAARGITITGTAAQKTQPPARKTPQGLSCQIGLCRQGLAVVFVRAG